MPTLFISHASEDKVEIARPLASALIRMGFNVWFDEFTLTLGDNLRRSIDEGLGRCDYGVVILSHSFFNKEWPQQELDGLVTREIETRKLILPVWHKVTKRDVQKYSSLLANRVAVKTDAGLHTVVEEITRAVARDFPPAGDNNSALLEQLPELTEKFPIRYKAPLTPTKELVIEAIEYVERLYESPDGIEPHSVVTGLRDFDRMTRGLRGGQVTAVLGTLASGKSSLAIGFARSCALAQDRGVLFASDQLNAPQAVLRLLAAAAKLSLPRMLDGYLRDGDFPELTSAAAKLAESKFEVYDRTPFSVEAISSVAFDVQKRHRLSLLIIDHLDSLTDTRSADGRTRAATIAATITGLRDLARSLEIPIVLLVDLKFAPEESLPVSEIVARDDVGYIMLRDADTVIHISIAGADDPDAETFAGHRATLTLLKNQLGIGEIPLRWDLGTLQFSDWENDDLE